MVTQLLFSEASNYTSLLLGCYALNIFLADIKKPLQNDVWDGNMGNGG